MLCDFSKEFPQFVADILERERGLRRRFREESITDMWIAALVPLRPYGFFVDLSDEASTGADLELWFLSKDRSRGLGFVVQAKRLSCRRERATPFACQIKDWRRHRFEHLDHAAGSGRKGSQSWALVRASKTTGRPVYPLYAFYSPKHIWHSTGRIKGVMLADGYEIHRRIVLGRFATRKKSPAKRRAPADYKTMGELARVMFHLGDLFCVEKSFAKMPIDKAVDVVLLKMKASRFGILRIPPPERVAESVRKVIGRGRAEGCNFPLPTVSDQVPADIQQIVAEGSASGGHHFDASIGARARLVFVATDGD